GHLLTPLRSQLACFSPNIFCKKSGEVIGMDAAGQSIKRRFGKQCYTGCLQLDRTDVIPGRFWLGRAG
ncbi:hypothetical protein, partial [Enterobacter hormaechei]|uniref:hypothetical protein n=1 Tax=Enterobacter hormaechei TaxID=158836 RepID=UPI001F3CDE6E